jgi:hypothetical protein
MKASHNDLEYVEIAAPADKIRLLFPANTFSVRLTNDHAEITISTDLAGIGAVKEKLDALAALMTVQMQQPDVIQQFEVGKASTPETPAAQLSPASTPTPKG